NLQAGGQSAVAGGGLVLSQTENNSSLINAGYVKIGATQVGDVWQERTNGTPPVGRWQHTAVWTGSEMIIWGGRNDNSLLNDGGRQEGRGGWGRRLDEGRRQTWRHRPR